MVRLARSQAIHRDRIKRFLLIGLVALSFLTLTGCWRYYHHDGPNSGYHHYDGYRSGYHHM